ncbi:histidine phosphatase family protein [Streptococcus merionis]|uniref:histidine phosphatase family protein n=1 Tax=Streptococcus merionis TaxID=400065 RepID=UPI0026EFC9C7|nr:histidine phosphatase family protein [Streptococcus merionis]
MKVIFIRHSEPDYSMLDKTQNPQAYAGFGRDLAPLTARGRLLAQEAAQNPLLDEAEVIISSSITRALETAFYMARHRAINLLVEPFFHEWRPDLDGLNYTEVELALAHQTYMVNDGNLPSDSPIRYETGAEVKARFLLALKKYCQYETVAVVAHGMLMRQFVPLDHIDYCQFVTCDIDL